MKLRARVRIIYCLFAIILLILGMCSEMETDSSFVYHAPSLRESSICTENKFSQMKEVCTNEMLRNDSVMYLCSNVRKSFLRTVFDVTILIGIVAIWLQYLFYFKMSRRWEYAERLTSHVFNINYIHRQDGEK